MQQFPTILAALAMAAGFVGLLLLLPVDGARRENEILNDRLATYAGEAEMAKAKCRLWKGVAKSLADELRAAEPLIDLGKRRRAALERDNAKRKAARAGLTVEAR